MELVSIVVPVYNGEKYIDNCVRFLQAQTYTNLEVIFVNDGSSDNSRDVCEKAIAADDRFYLINKENGGTASTRNKGLENAHGKYITFFDVDDEFSPVIIEKMVLEMEKNTADLVVCGYYFKIEEKWRQETLTTYLEEKKYPYSVFPDFNAMRKEYIDLWDKDMFSNVWNKMYRMETIQKHKMRYRDGHVYTEDRVFNRLFLSKCAAVVILDECLYYYVRERVGSTTEQYRTDYFAIRNKEYKEFRQHFQEMKIWDERAREYTCREFIERIAGCIENIFHAGDSLTRKEKYSMIHGMIHHPDVREAIKYARCRSRKMRVFVLPIKWDWTPGAYIMGNAIYRIRKANPVLFHKLKSRR